MVAIQLTQYRSMNGPIPAKVDTFANSQYKPDAQASVFCRGCEYTRLRFGLVFVKRAPSSKPTEMLLEQTLVVPHHEVTIDLLHQVKRHALGDQ